MTATLTPAAAPLSPGYPGPEPLSPALLADIADGLARSEELWRGAVRHDPAERRPVRLVATERYEVWVIGWTPGQGVDLHDHGESSGHLVVTEGELTELVPTTGGTASRTLVAGHGHTLPFGMIHDIVNRSGGPATSIHVYSPPLEAMTYYDDVSLAAVRTDPGTWIGAGAVDPAVDATAVARALHPATGA